MTFVRTCEDTHLFHTEDQELMEKTTKEDEEQTGRSTDSWYQSSPFSSVSTWSRTTFLSCSSLDTYVHDHDQDLDKMSQHDLDQLSQDRRVGKGEDVRVQQRPGQLHKL